MALVRMEKYIQTLISTLRNEAQLTSGNLWVTIPELRRLCPRLVCIAGRDCTYLPIVTHIVVLRLRWSRLEPCAPVRVKT